jgi:hypothetical protein
MQKRAIKFVGEGELLAKIHIELGKEDRIVVTIGVVET